MADCVTSRLLLPRPCLRTIREHAGTAWPLEACGLLEGFAVGRSVRVMRIIPCRNEHEQPADRYRIDPEVFLRADCAAERNGHAIVGVWHSHPNGGIYFSDTDRAEAWPGWSYLVAGVTNGRMNGLRCWRVEEDVTEQRLQTV